MPTSHRGRARPLRGLPTPLVTLLSVGALALVIAACAPDEEAPDDQPDVTEDEEVDDASDGGGGGDLRVAAPSTVVSLDPHGGESAERPTLMIAQHLMDPLVTYDGEDFHPHLATEWDNPDDTTWVFQMRDDVEFHDGEPLTAEDAAASLNRLIELEGPLAPVWEAVETVEATDEHELTIETSEPLGTVLSNLTVLFVGPADRIEDEGFWDEPVGSGPFEIEEFAPDERVVLVPNEDYWDGAPEPDSVEVVEIPETAARMTAMETGEIDMTWSIPPDQIDRLRDDPSVEVETVPGFTYYFIWFNNEREPFTDVDVRRALWHAVDYEQIMEDLFPGMAQTAHAPIPEPVFGWSENDPYEYDPELAEELLAEAGYEDGFETTLDVFPGAGPLVREVSQVMQSYWADVGVDVELLEKERAEWLDDLLELEWDMNINDNTALTGDADFVLGRLYLCGAERLGYCNEELDEILLDARQSLDNDEREELYAQANEILWEDAAGMFPMDLLDSYAWRDHVQGVELPVNALPRFNALSVEE